VAGKKQVPRKLKALISSQAGYRCGYCLSPEHLMGAPMTIEHLVPDSKGGKTVEENLWLSCDRCNVFKGAQTTALDPKTGKETPLFNPRHQKWQEHFRWRSDGLEIEGITACGRATIVALQLNNPYIVTTRQQWVSAGWWPPQE
jgi:hypothetical protein